MEFQSDTVTAYLSYDCIAVFDSVFMYSLSHIAQI